MRRSPVTAVAALAAVVAGGYAATAGTSQSGGGEATASESRPPAKLRRCKTRIEGTRPSPSRVHRDSVVLGPLEFSGLKRLASARVLETFPDRDGGYSIKSAVSVRAGRDVTLAIAPDQRPTAELTYVQSGRRARFLDSDTVRFKACDRDEPAFAHDGTVGGRTWFNGGLHVDAPMCLKLEAWVRGRAEPYRVTVPLGMGDKCEAPASASGARVSQSGCDRAVGTFGRRQVSIGSVAAVRAVRGYADPAVADRFRDEDTGGYGFKAPLAVRRGKVVTISIARTDRDWASLGIDGQTNADSVRLTACPRPAPRSVPPYERKWSSWVNGFRIKRLGCLHLVARERGRAQIHRATLSFGMGRGAC